MVEAVFIIYFIGAILASILTSIITKKMYPGKDSSVINLIMSALSWFTILLWLLSKDERNEEKGTDHE